MIEKNQRFFSLPSISLLQTVTTIQIGGNVALASLPISFTGATPAIITGWGGTCEHCSIPEQLQRLDTQVLDQQECRRIIRNNPWYSSDKLCALAGTGVGQAVCGGDSGGPVSVGRTVVGIVSWGFYPCGIGLPDMHERVFSHRNWILRNLG